MRRACEGSCTMGVFVRTARGPRHIAPNKEHSVKGADTKESRGTGIVQIPQDNRIRRDAGDLCTNGQVIVILPVRSASCFHGQQKIAGRHAGRQHRDNLVRI